MFLKLTDHKDRVISVNVNKICYYKPWDQGLTYICFGSDWTSVKETAEQIDQLLVEGYIMIKNGVDRNKT